MASDVRVILVTAPAEKAPEIARRMVEERLAACVNLVPQLRSVYRWEGEVEEALETLLICKTTHQAVPALQDRLQHLHPYDVPECLVLEVADGLPAYLAWVAAESGAR